MSEEAVQVEETEVEMSEDEKTARQYGWKPEDEYEGDPDGWVSAKVFNQRGELFGKIKSLERQNDSMQKSFEEMKRMLSKAQETEYKKALKSLTEQKREAIESGDADQTFEIEKEIDNLKTDFEVSSKSENTPVTPQEFVTWKEENDWYTTDDVMTIYADSVGMKYAQQNPNLPLKDVYEYVTSQIKAKFPEKFSTEGGKKQMKESKVEGARASGSPTSKGKQKFTEKDLSDEQRTIMNTMVRSGAMNKDEYIAELVRIGEVG